MSASSEAPIPLAGVAGFNRNQWQLSIGISGNLRLESVAGFDRNQWQPSRGIRKIAARREPPECEQAEIHYLQALALAEELGMRPLLAHCQRGLGTLYATTGQREQAHTELSAALALYRGMDMTFWLPQTEAALAQVEGR